MRKLQKAQKWARILYTFTFLLTAVGILLEALGLSVSKMAFAAALLALAGYLGVVAAFLRCPQCGCLIQINPLHNLKKCPKCGINLTDE